ncbi:polysaccharide lyase family 7 protein [Hyaloscypha variabilis]
MSIKSTLQALFLLPLALGVTARHSTKTTSSTKSAPSATSTAPGKLNPSCAPGGNFDLSVWSLQLPIGSTDKPDVITSSQLEGCSGYTNPSYFYTNSKDGALVMKVPGSPASAGCVTTSGSLHCRTEFRETSPSSWDPKASLNRLTAQLAVITPDNGSHGTVIGQVFNSAASKPVGELFYSQAGLISIGVEQTAAGGDEIVTDLGSVPVGEVFTYVIAYEGGVLSVTINGGAAKVLSTFSLDSPPSYFKAGNYDQGSDASEVHFYSLKAEHSS